MKKIGIRYLKKIAIGIASLAAFLILVTFIFTFLFKAQLIQFVIDQLDKQVDAQINIAKVDFSLWRQFPNASVQLNNVYAQSSNRYKLTNEIKRPDTLIWADKIFFEFNLMKLINGKFELKQISVKNGYVKLKIDKDGKGNFEIIRPTDKPKENQSSFKLKDLVFINTILEYNNLKSGVKILGLAEKLRIKGNFGAKDFDLTLNSSLFLKQLVVSDYSYIINKPVQLDLNLIVNDSKYLIRNAQCKIVDLKFEVAGGFDLGPNENIDLKVTGHRLNLAQVIDALPDKVGKSLSEYSGKGQVSINLSVIGAMGKHGSPKIILDGTLNNGTLTQKKSGLKLKNVNLNGFYNKQNDEIQSSVLRITQFSSNFGSGHISGDLSIEHNIKQAVQFNARYKLNLSELKQFLNIDTLELLSGQVEGNLIASGRINKTSGFKLSDFTDVICKGQFVLHDGGVKIKSSDYYFEKINGSVAVNNDLYFNNISLYILDNDFLVNGSLNDWLSYLLKRRKDLTLHAEISSRNLDLSKYFVSDAKKVKSGYSRELLFPDNINLDLKLNINNFKLNKFNAKSATGYLNYKPKMFVLKSLSFETLSGRVNGNGAIIQDVNKNFIVKGQVDVTRLDIRNLFYTFNNFSQNILKDYHLKGCVSGKIGISSEWNNALVVNKDKLMVDADITIENGELLNFEPMFSLSRFISMNELKNMKFSTLKNRIYIKDKQIVIPQMDVSSSAFDITASGVHLFDNHYTYKVKILLSDILWSKARRAKKENEEFGTVEDDGLGKTSLPLSIVGFNHDYKISYDSKKAMEVVRENLKKQKNELKSIFKDEFGWYKNDSTLKDNKIGKKSSVKVEWDEANEKTMPSGNDSKETKPLHKKTKEETQKVEWE